MSCLVRRPLALVQCTRRSNSECKKLVCLVCFSAVGVEMDRLQQDSVRGGLDAYSWWTWFDPH